MQILTVDELTVRLILSFPGLRRPVKFSFEYSATQSNLSKKGKFFFVWVGPFLKVLFKVFAINLLTRDDFNSPSHTVNLRVLKSNMRYILRYYEELIWSKYCVEILRGKIRTDFIRMDVPMFQVDPNIHYILIASLPRDLNWDNAVNRLLLNLGEEMLVNNTLLKM